MAYDPTTGAVDFGLAITELKRGERMTRLGWSGRGMWIALQEPTKLSKMTRPYIFMKTVDGDLVPWVASQTDILATDWINFIGEEL
jgi:hypothetical protein